MSLPQPPPPPPPLAADRCYRHPNREAGRRCTRCGRPACSECLVQASVGSHCVDCARAARPDVRTRARNFNARQVTLVTYVLMAVNIAIFVAIAALDTSTLTSRRLAFTPGEFGQDDLWLRRSYLLDGQWYRLISSGFLHFGIIHIAFNMLLLFQLGQLLEPILGRVRFAMLYVAALLAGSAGAMLLEPDAFVGGASGAVFGLMGAAAVAMHRRGINIFTTGLGTTLMLNLVLTFSINGISIGGHLGGVVGGAVAGWFMLAPNWRRSPEWASYVAPVVVAIASFAVAYVVAR